MAEGNERSEGERGESIGVSSLPEGVLPMDIIEGEILCRIPVKSLLRCQLVCKRWYSLIRNPNPRFIKSHYHHHERTLNPFFLEYYFATSRLPSTIAFNPSSVTEYGGCIWSSPMVVHQKPGNSLSFQYYLGFTPRTVVLPPVNGISLIVHADTGFHRCRMATLNPSTRRFCKLPLDFDFNYIDSLNYSNHVFGFGLCSNNHDKDDFVYKVVWLNLPPNQPSVPVDDDVVAKVYTFGDQDWRVLNADLPRKFVQDYINVPSLTVSMKHKCYWLSKDLSRILVFDMNDEVFREIGTPLTPLNRNRSKKAKGAVFFSEVPSHGEGGHSDLASFVFEHDFVDIWMLNTEELSWFHRRAHYVNRPFCDLFDQSSLPMEQFKSPVAEFMVLKAGRRSFVLYNPKTNRCVCFDTPAVYLNRYLFVVNLKESLFSMAGEVQLSDRVIQDFMTFPSS